MGRIRRLSDELANQIAAGEVVERPSSVVKELVENALDAGATRIAVDVENGGTSLIRVNDDGEGMANDDAVLCLERHATSKIERLADLSAIGTFGFRGEALPSIASVSRLVLTTRRRDTDEGLEVSVTGGAPPVTGPAGAAIGTTIEVRDLFFNVPARKKFLKATATEAAHVTDVVVGAALARPDVTFVLSRDGRVVRELLRAKTREERATAAIQGERFVHVAVSRGAIAIEAVLAPPERARSGATGLSLLVNGRPVRDRLLARAVAQSYGSVLEAGRYPVGVVWLDVPHELVDVNVHPQKAEVRFADARGMLDGVTRELHAALGKSFGLPPTPYRTAAPASFSMPAASGPGFATPSPGGRPLEEMSNLFALEKPPETVATVDKNLDVFGERGLYASLRYVGQLKSMFLVCEGDDGMYVLDQHAAAERVTFDRLRRAHAARGMKMQRLLVPEIVEMPASDVALVEQNAEEVLALGLEARAAGDTSVAVHAVPAMLARAEPARLLRDVVAELSRESGRPFRGAVDLVLATMACHGSVRAGDAMTREAVVALLAALDEVDFAGHCPHGRPLVLRMPWGELERRVGR